jgi:hypothetical protein
MRRTFVTLNFMNAQWSDSCVCIFWLYTYFLALRQCTGSHHRESNVTLQGVKRFVALLGREANVFKLFSEGIEGQPIFKKVEIVFCLQGSRQAMHGNSLGVAAQGASACAEGQPTQTNLNGQNPEIWSLTIMIV